MFGHKPSRSIDLWRRFRHVLEVVEHQEEPPLAEVLAENLERGCARCLPQAQGPQDGRHDERRVS